MRSTYTPPQTRRHPVQRISAAERVRAARSDDRPNAGRRRLIATSTAALALLFGVSTTIPAVAWEATAAPPSDVTSLLIEQELQVSTTAAPAPAEMSMPIATRVDPRAAAVAQATAVPDAAQSAASSSYLDGEPVYPSTWAALETEYIQTPFPGLTELPISSPFAPRWGKFHMGIDIPLGQGTPIFPVANGVVAAVFQGNHPSGGGYMVVVEHNIGGRYFQSWYAHMRAGSIDVEEGDVVSLDTQIGAVGSTGNSTGPHLHLEIKDPDFVSIDPAAWLVTREEVRPPAGF